MKKISLLMISLLLILPLCACENISGFTKPSASPNTEVSIVPAQDAPTQLPSVEPSEKPPEEPSPSPSEKPHSLFGSGLDKPEAPIPSHTPKPSPSVSNEKTPLPAESLAYLTSYFAQQENYGFLLSSYDRPEDVDLQEVFYAGAGIATWDISQAEIDAFMDYYGVDELWGGIMKLTSVQLDDFMLEKTGVSIWDTTGTFDWVYLAEFDAFYVERSDTNYCSLECVEGYKTADGTVVVECLQPPDGYGQVDRCTVTLKKSGDDLLFFANEAHMLY